MSTVDRVAGVFSKIFIVPADSISLATEPNDVQKWDSLGHLNMVAALEKEFGVEFELDEVMEMSSVGKIVDLLAAKGA